MNREAYERVRAAELEYLRANNWVEQGPEDWSHEALGRSHVTQGHAVNIQKQLDRMALGGPQRAKDGGPKEEMRAKPVRISFDIGGVLTKYPHIFRPMISALLRGGAEVFVLTDMTDRDKAVKMVRENGYNIPAGRILTARYDDHGEDCKAVVIETHEIDVHVDDFPGYCAHTKGLSLFTWPNPELPYYHDDFKTDGSEGDFGRRRKARRDDLPTGLLAVPAKWTFKPEEMSTENLQSFVEGRHDSMNEGDDALVAKEREQAKEELRKRSIMALICWRGERALDWYGEDLIFHVLGALRRMSRDEVPPAHKEAYDLFRKLDDDERYTLAARALDEAP